MVENETFHRQDFSKGLPEKDYDTCTFVDCNFANADLSDVLFVECVFEDCDLSMAKMDKTSIKDVEFKGCKMLGIHFDVVHTFLLEMRFYKCQLNLSSFYRLPLKGTVFQDCQLEEVDFVEADLTNARFDDCNLHRAVFENTILEKADFRKAFHYTFDPESNHVHKAKFSQDGIIGLLGKYGIEIE